MKLCFAADAVFEKGMERLAGILGYEIAEDGIRLRAEQGEKIGVAAFFCRFEEDTVLFRISFDQQMQLVGLSLQRQ